VKAATTSQRSGEKQSAYQNFRTGSRASRQLFIESRVAARVFFPPVAFLFLSFPIVSCGQSEAALAISRFCNRSRAHLQSMPLAAYSFAPDFSENYLDNL
jgi:hypothetical protein